MHIHRLYLSGRRPFRHQIMTQLGALKKMMSLEYLAAPTRKEGRSHVLSGSLTLVIAVTIVVVTLAPGTSAQYTESGAWMGLENNTVVNISAQLASTAFLPCSVRMIGDKQISWIRRRDWHVLTSGIYTYTNDERFSITHRDGADDWTLSIKFLQKRDNGTYECQISTGTGIISQFVNVHVIVPEAFILGNSEFHIQTGSAINLYCIIEQSPIPPQYVFWKHNNRILNYDKERGGVSVIMEHGTKTSSRLIIYGATTADSGNYTCGAPSTEPATVNVFVSQGDKTAAIQRRTSGTGATHSVNNGLHILFISSLMLLQFILDHHLLTQTWVLPRPSDTTTITSKSSPFPSSSSSSSSLLSSLILFLSFTSPRKS